MDLAFRGMAHQLGRAHNLAPPKPDLGRCADTLCDPAEIREWNIKHGTPSGHGAPPRGCPSRVERRCRLQLGLEMGRCFMKQQEQHGAANPPSD